MYTYTDASDVYHSTIFSDSPPASSLGGWGDPSRDYSISTGGFSSHHVSYPVPHTLRRNFTLQPYLNFGGPFFPDLELEANATFTTEEVSKMVTGFEGDFKGFQKYFESFQVGWVILQNMDRLTTKKHLGSSW